MKWLLNKLKECVSRILSLLGLKKSEKMRGVDVYSQALDDRGDDPIQLDGMPLDGGDPRRQEMHIRIVRIVDRGGTRVINDNLTVVSNRRGLILKLGSDDAGTDMHQRRSDIVVVCPHDEINKVIPLLQGFLRVTGRTVIMDMETLRRVLNP